MSIKDQPVRPIGDRPVYIEDKGLSSANLQTALLKPAPAAPAPSTSTDKK